MHRTVGASITYSRPAFHVVQSTSLVFSRLDLLTFLSGVLTTKSSAGIGIPQM